MSTLTMTSTPTSVNVPRKSCHFMPPPPIGKFAFARLRSDPHNGVHLVQLVEPPAPRDDCSVDLIGLHLFRHEFISIFRHAGSTTVHPEDIRILQVIDDTSKRYEEDRGVVFLERQVAVEGMRRRR